MLLGIQYQIEFMLYVCTCVMWALRADIWQHSCIINNTDQQQHSTCYKYNMYICYNSISVSNSVSISVESLIENCGGSIFMYSWLALINEFTSSTKNNHESLNFPTETENRCIHKIISPQISKTHNPWKLAPMKLNDSTVYGNFHKMWYFFVNGLLFISFQTVLFKAVFTYQPLVYITSN